jgi:hypothetical protein
MGNISVIILLLGFCPFLFFLLKINIFKSFKSIIPFVFLIFLSSSYELIFSYFLKINVSFWFLVYNILSFFCVFYFFYFELKRKNNNFFLLTFILFVILLIYLYQNFNMQEVLIINSYLKIFITSFILICTTLWFVKLIKEGFLLNLLQTGSFYFIAGFVIYYCGTLFLFLLSDQLYKTDPKLFTYYWGINIFLNFVLRTLLLVGLWKLRVK